MNFSQACVAPVKENWSDGALEVLSKRKIITPLLQPSIFPVLRARADQFATIRPLSACTETGRANDWDGPAKIPFYPA